MRRKNLDLIIVLFIAMLNVGWALIPNHLPFIGVIFALPVVFLLPGYTLTEALFKYVSNGSEALMGRAPTGIAGSFPLSNRLVFSLGLSLILDIITGLILDVLPIGLQQKSWAVALCFLTAIFALIAFYRRRGTQDQQIEQPGVARPRYRIAFYEYVLIALALIVTASAVWYSTNSALQQQQQQSFTQFWMVPSKQANDSCAVLIGLQSFESSPMTYRVVLTAGGAPLSTWSSVALAPQQQWYQSVPVKLGVADTVTLDARLYRTNKLGSPYRETHITFNVAGSGSNRKLRC